MSKTGTFYNKALFQNGKYETPKHLRGEPPVVAHNTIVSVKDIKCASLAEDIRTYEPTSKYRLRNLKILVRDKGICGLCKEPIQRLKDFNIDHIIPKSVGGSNAYDNLQATHRKCNHLKGCNQNLTIEDFRRGKAGEKEKQDEVIDTKTDHCAELYNEIQRHGTTRLSFKTFKDYFIKYHITQLALEK